MELRTRRSFAPGFPCLICGVDSGPIRWFLIVFFGGFFLASLSVALWAYSSGRLKDQEKAASMALEADSRGE